MSADTFDDVLTRFAATGPEFGPGLSNHGPMAAEALVALGRGDAVASWAEWYAPRLMDPPDARNRIDAAAWQAALGDVGRVGDWAAFFHSELAERPWTDVVAMWAPRLAPGVMAGATHGILRTAHAVRALERDATATRIGELAEGLAYWAARYQLLPEAGAAPGAKAHPVAGALALVACTPEDQRHRGMIFDAVKAIDAGAFAPVINLVDVDVEVDAFVSEITRSFVRHYLANARHASIAFIHTVTAPSALRTLAPHLAPADRRSAMRYLWQACASIYAAYGTGPAIELGGAGPLPDMADLIDQAVAARDEHAIKFTEACLREHRLSGDGAFLAAAQDVVLRLRRA